MNFPGTAALLVITTMTAAMASAEGLANSPTLLQARQPLILIADGNGNRLVLDQNGGTPQGNNRLSLALDGSRNGGPQGATFAAPLAGGGLEPGQITQAGSGNAIALAIRGDDNLFAVLQSGHYNSIHAEISGSGNQAVIAQFQSGNYTFMSQNGTGNIVNVQQTSW